MITPKMTEDYMNFAADEYKEGRLSGHQYHEIMMRVAAEFLIDHNIEDKAMVALNRVPEDFIQNVLPAAMENDTGLAMDMLEFAYHLERRGITFEGTIRPTQTPAEA